MLTPVFGKMSHLITSEIHLILLSTPPQSPPPPPLPKKKVSHLCGLHLFVSKFSVLLCWGEEAGIKCPQLVFEMELRPCQWWVLTGLKTSQNWLVIFLGQHYASTILGKQAICCDDIPYATICHVINKINKSLEVFISFCFGSAGSINSGQIDR